MRRIARATEPEPFRKWRNENPGANWSHLSDPEKQTPSAKNAFSALRSALLSEQGRLCAYCERGVHIGATTDRTTVTIDHVEPKSKVKGRTFDFANLVATCDGGATSSQQWCNAKKANSPLPKRLDPREIPKSPPLWRLKYNRGRHEIEPDPDACQSEGIDLADARECLEILGLNAPQLSALRTEVYFRAAAELEDPMSATRWLAPDPTGDLQPFWTTARLALGEVAEAWLKDHYP